MVPGPDIDLLPPELIEKIFSGLDGQGKLFVFFFLSRAGHNFWCLLTKEVSVYLFVNESTIIFSLKDVNLIYKRLLC